MSRLERDRKAALAASEAAQRKQKQINQEHTHEHQPNVPASTVRHNRRAWVRAVRGLGDKWLLAEPVAKREAA